jgi:hypothetical protein
MRWALRDVCKTNSTSVDSTISSLVSAVSDEHFLIFTQAQNKAIKHFLEYMAQLEKGYGYSTQAEFALTYYWNHAKTA